MNRKFVLVAAVALALVGAAQASAPINDPPRIVGWRLIGNVGLGMSRERIEYFYGAAFDDRIVVAYRLHGGELSIGYTNGYVTGVATTSPYYRTKDGIGVGTRIPLGPCHRTKANPCERRWRGFVLGQYLGFWWTRRTAVGTGGRKTYACLYVRRGVVKEIQIISGWFARAGDTGYAGCH